MLWASPPSPLMNADTMKSWHLAGMEVGSHTLDHPRLTELPLDAAALQIQQSRNLLGEHLGVPVTAFCYPYGEQSDALRQLVRDAGYSNATTTVGGLVRPDDDRFALPRVTVSRSTHLLRFLQKCLTRMEDRRRAA